LIGNSTPEITICQINQGQRNLIKSMLILLYIRRFYIKLEYFSGPDLKDSLLNENFANDLIWNEQTQQYEIPDVEEVL